MTIFVCNHYFAYRSSGEIKDKSYFRVNTFHNKRKNSRGHDKKKLSRWRISKQSSCCENRGCFSMFITIDDIGFYNLSHIGYQNHQNHPKLSQEEITYPSILLETSEKIFWIVLEKSKWVMTSQSKYCTKNRDSI